MNCLKIVLNIYLLTSIIRPNETIRLTDEFISLFTLSLKRKDLFSAITLSLSFVVLVLFTLMKPLLSNQEDTIRTIQRRTHEIKYPLTVCENKMADEKDITSHSIIQEIDAASLPLIDQKEKNISRTVEQERSIDSPLIMQHEEHMHTSSYASIEQKDASAATVETKVKQTEAAPISIIENEEKAEVESILPEIIEQENMAILSQTMDQEELPKDQHKANQANKDVSSHYLPLKQLHVMSVLPNNDMEQVIPFTITTSLLHESIDNGKLVHDQPYLTRKDESSSEHDSSESEQSSTSMQEQEEQQEGSSDRLPSYQLSTTTYTCSRRSSEANTTCYTAPKSQLEQLAIPVLENRQTLKDVSIVNEYNIMPQSEKSTSSLSKNRFSSIRLKRKKSINKNAAEVAVSNGPKPSPKPSVSTKIQDKLKKSGKRFSKIFS